MKDAIVRQREFSVTVSGMPEENNIFKKEQELIKENCLQIKEWNLWNEAAP